MDMGWSSVGIKCPDCKGDTVLFQVAVSADGEFRFRSYCQTCRENVEWLVFASQLIHRASENDIEKLLKSNPIVPVSRRLKPPLQIPPDKLSEEDKKLMEDFGISEDNDDTPPKTP